MPAPSRFYEFQSDGVSFTSKAAAQMRLIYAPLCGIDATGLKSAITPYLSGDIKLDKFRYLTKPVSREDLRQPARNFWVTVEGKGTVSFLQDTTVENAQVEVGQLWHKVTRGYPWLGVELTALNFIPVTGEDVELMQVTVTNTSGKSLTITPTASIPIFGRALANKHDHEHVTALLQRTRQTSAGVVVEPVMAFNEEGHKPVSAAYFVLGCSGQGENPQGSFPTVESFCGEGGTFNNPEAVEKNLSPRELPAAAIHGKEAVGALRFRPRVLEPGASEHYLLVMGIASGEAKTREIFARFATLSAFEQALAENKKYWERKIGTLQFNKKDPEFNAWIKWVTLQPVLRRIFGCSFLPDHDYGKGGKGWRDIWQDLLSLILIEPGAVRGHLINNFGGVRVDGSNATIIGDRPGEFIADRNAITRVWMDHGAWPLLTTLLYVDQTGDSELLFETTTYFRDPQLSRTLVRDATWTPEYGNKLKTRSGKIYKGTILEHLLVQNLVQFFNVGEHNITRLESADWNDGLDMAAGRGESVAFMAFYAGNLLKIADLLEKLASQRGVKKIRLAREVTILLDTLQKKSCAYDKAETKRQWLLGKYFKAVQPKISGKQVDVPTVAVIADLRKKGQWAFDLIRRQEKVTVTDSGAKFTWFNGYYDNRAARVEGKKKDRVWMTLTGQVFPIMSGLADNQEISQIMASARRYLQDPALGGFRLNSDFGLKYYLDLGRAFGFIYGTKENGAFFNHMSVMFAYALYARGFVKEGREVLDSIYAMSLDLEKSKIYPGVPEYFDGEGRGMYHFLTGSASWMVLTQLTQVCGVRGSLGDLMIEPKLSASEFNQKGEARVVCQFAGKKVTVIYQNNQCLDFGEYTIRQIQLNGQLLPLSEEHRRHVVIPRAQFPSLAEAEIRVTLGR